MNARDVIANSRAKWRGAYSPNPYDYAAADAILADLGADGWRIVKLERMNYGYGFAIIEEATPWAPET